MKSTILVPTDFTDAANTALKHAITISETSDVKLIVVHICKNKESIVTARKKLAEWIGSVAPDANVEAVVRVGDYTDITNTAKELAAELIFMGTHGAKGLQKIMGSNALKLVTSSNIPFIIVQKNASLSSGNGYQKILATVSHNRESKQKVKSIMAVAKYFDSQVILLYRDESDDSLRIDTATNLVFVKRELDQAGIKYEVKLSKGKNFNEDTIAIAKKHNVDLITIMNMQMNTILGTGLLGPNYEQELLMNEEKIPVMIVSPTQNGRFGNVTMM